MNKIFYIKRAMIAKVCEGCKEVINIGKPRIYSYKSWRGSLYKAHYHDKDCLMLDKN